MKKTASRFSLAGYAAPWLTLAVLVGLSMLMPNRSRSDPEAQKHNAAIARAMESVPYFIQAGWVGEDAREMIPREAQELLHPNCVLSRTYSRSDGAMVHVLIVHCCDARDMIGHYPPICYPSSGWVPRDDSQRDESLHVRSERLLVREYLFSRPRSYAGEDVIRIFNAFILPDGRVTPQIDDIYRQSERLALSVQGVAQIQLITMAGMPADEAAACAEELLAGMGDLLNALQVAGGAS